MHHEAVQDASVERTVNEFDPIVRVEQSIAVGGCVIQHIGQDRLAQGAGVFGKFGLRGGRPERIAGAVHGAAVDLLGDVLAKPPRRRSIAAACVQVDRVNGLGAA